MDTGYCNLMKWGLLSKNVSHIFPSSQLHIWSILLQYYTEDVRGVPQLPRSGGGSGVAPHSLYPTPLRSPSLPCPHPCVSAPGHGQQLGITHGRPRGTPIRGRGPCPWSPGLIPALYRRPMRHVRPRPRA